ncbi:MAG TPA: TMEM175 family protein [Ktedonobacteraceae bacterium]|nr:TMEM175 family protein [Ktedonobacteraceae bacterium]
MKLHPQKDDERPRPPGVGTKRLEAFSDGIFAIAITLLALNLQVPVLTTITPHTLVAALGAKWPTYLTFMFSFVTLLIAWVYHHRLLQWVEHAETGLLFLNGMLLLIVSAVPFPTALLGAYLTTPAASVASAIYAGYIAVLNFTYNLLWWVVVRQHCRNHPSGWRPPTNMILSFLGFPCYLVALLIAFWSPVASLIICGTLWVVWTMRAPSMDALPMSFHRKGVEP